MLNFAKRRCAAVLVALIGVLVASAVQAAPFAYVANFQLQSVSVIDIATNTVTATIANGTNPNGIAVNADGSRVYVTNQNTNTVSVIDGRRVVDRPDPTSSSRDGRRICGLVFRSPRGVAATAGVVRRTA